MSYQIKPQTVTLIGKLLHPLTESALIPFPEYREIIAQLKHLAEHGQIRPLITPRLITQEEAAQLLGIGLSNFKKLEKEGAFPFRRRMLGGGVRYRNTDVIDFIQSED
jgi:hypothetical protein